MGFIDPNTVFTINDVGLSHSAFANMNWPQWYIRRAMDTIKEQGQDSYFETVISSHDGTGRVKSGELELTFDEYPSTSDGIFLILASRVLKGSGPWVMVGTGFSEDVTLKITDFSTDADPVITVETPGRKGTLQNLRFEGGVLSGWASGAMNREVAISMKFMPGFLIIDPIPVPIPPPFEEPDPLAIRED